MLVLIDNYDSFTYNLFQLIGTQYSDIRVFRNDKITVSEVLEMRPKGIVFSPGPGVPKNAGITCDLIKECPEEIPVFGVCLGHQAIAEVFGGAVVLAPEVVHGKKATIFHDRKNLFTDMPLPFEAGRYHSLIVDKESLPLELSIDAESHSGEIMALSHDSLPRYGVQFHPESILTDGGAQLIANFLKECSIATKN